MSFDISVPRSLYSTRYVQLLVNRGRSNVSGQYSSEYKQKHCVPLPTDPALIFRYV